MQTKISDQKLQLKTLEDLKSLGENLGDGKNDPIVRPLWFNLEQLERAQKLAEKNRLYIYFWYQFVLQGLNYVFFLKCVF